MRADIVFHVVLVVKQPPTKAGDTGSIPGWGRSLGGGNGNCSSILAWRILWTEKPGGLQSIGSQRVSHDWTRMHVGGSHSTGTESSKQMRSKQKWPPRREHSTPGVSSLQPSPQFHADRPPYPIPILLILLLTGHPVTLLQPSPSSMSLEPFIHSQLCFPPLLPTFHALLF